MNRTVLISATLLAFFLQSCKRENWPCIKGKGSITTETRTVSDFNSIEFQTEGTVYITKGTAFEVRIEAQPNIISDMKTEVNGSELKIYNRHCLRDHDQIKVYITLPDLRGIDLTGSGSMLVQSIFQSPFMDVNVSGSGNIEIQDSLLADAVNVNISGSGDVLMNAWCSSFSGKISGSGSLRVNGNSVTENLTISGSGEIHSFDLTVDQSAVNISGSGNCEVNVASTLDVSISGSGDVYYKGTPVVTTHISGSGNLIHVN